MNVSNLTPARILIPVGVAAALGGLALAVFLALGPAPKQAAAADHLDAPGLTPPGGGPSTDIADVYAFQSPGRV